MCTHQAACEVKQEGRGFPPAVIRNGIHRRTLTKIHITAVLERTRLKGTTCGSFFAGQALFTHMHTH